MNLTLGCPERTHVLELERAEPAIFGREDIAKPLRALPSYRRWQA
jgi:hypothetical protein